jgi:hypothetical protein
LKDETLRIVTNTSLTSYKPVSPNGYFTFPYHKTHVTYTLSTFMITMLDVQDDMTVIFRVNVYDHYVRCTVTR